VLKIAGVILCITGFTGYGILKITSWNKAMAELEQWILLFEKMKSHIYYRRDIITDIFCKMEEGIFGIGGRYVAAVGKDMRDNRAKSFMLVWEEKMRQWECQSFLPLTVKKMILSFPEYVGEQDCEQQINHLEFYLHRLKTEKEKMEKEIDTKKKPVMAISLVCGITVSILLI